MRLTTGFHFRVADTWVGRGGEGEILINTIMFSKNSGGLGLIPPLLPQLKLHSFTPLSLQGENTPLGELSRKTWVVIVIWRRGWGAGGRGRGGNTVRLEDKEKLWGENIFHYFDSKWRGRNIRRLNS